MDVHRYKWPKDAALVVVAALPKPNEKLLFHVLENMDVEDESVEKLCGVIKKIFKLPFCSSILKDLWAPIAKKCPKDAALEGVAALPMPIEELLCDGLEDMDVEVEAVEKLCGFIEKKSLRKGRRGAGAASLSEALPACPELEALDLYKNSVEEPAPKV